MPMPAGSVELTAVQRVIFRHQLRHPGSLNYLGIIPTQVHGPLDLAILQRAVDVLVRRHEQLRAVFELGEDGPVRRLQEDMQVVVDFKDLSGASPAEATAWLAARLLRPVDMARGPLFRVAMATVGPDEHVFGMSLHHLVMDLWSGQILFDDVFALYATCAAGVDPTLPAIPLYTDVMGPEVAFLKGPEGEALWQYWSERLPAELPALALPYDQARRSRPSGRTGTEFFEVDGETVAAGLKTFAPQRASAFTLVLAALQALLFRVTGNGAVRVLFPSHGRDRPESYGIVGCFTRQALWAVDVSGLTFRGLVERAKVAVPEVLKHGRLPFPELAERLHAEGRAHPATLAPVQLTFQKFTDPTQAQFAALLAGRRGTRVERAGLAFSPVPLPQQEGQFDLELVVTPTETNFLCELRYDGDVFEASTVAALGRSLTRVFEQAVVHPDLPLERLELVGESSRERLLGALGARSQPRSAPSYVQRFEAQVEQTPDAVAVSGGEEAWSYRQLDTAANRVAQGLLALGHAPESVVGVLAERGPAFIATFLGILKAGLAYVPLDPQQPRDRQRRVLASSGARVLLVDAANASAALDLGAGCPVVSLEQTLLAHPSVQRPGLRLAPQALAYVVTTSGSTGIPKAAMVEHAGFLNHTLAFQDLFELSARDVVAQTAAQSFDISIWQMLTALLVGGRTHVVADPVTRDPEALLAELEHEGVTVLQLVPVMLAALVEAAPGRATSLRVVSATGESLSPELLRRTLETLPSVQVANAYGPTECSDDVALSLHSRPVERVPIGTPLPNLRLYVLDRWQGLLEPGLVGELCVGGVGVGRGYVGAPGTTALAFVPDPFAPEPGARAYRTGDLARWLPDGQLEFLGRRDQQVKVRGFRIELGEVEAALGSHPQVAGTAVVAVPGAGGNRLVAFIVGRGDGTVDAGELRDWAGRTLATAMHPALYLALGALPTTPAGKVDRAALLVQATQALSGVGASADAVLHANDSLESRLAAVWAAVLGLARVPPDADFFEQGGDSILAIHLASQARKKGMPLDPENIYRFPTLRAQVAELTRRQALPGGGAQLPGPSAAPPTYPLTRSQLPLWFQWALAKDKPWVDSFGAWVSCEVTEPRLLEGLTALMHRHRQLRAAVEGPSARPAHRVHEDVSPDLMVVDARGWEDARLTAALAAELAASWEVSRAPFFRVRAFLAGPGRSFLWLAGPHLLWDGWSQALLLTELVTLLVGKALPPSGRDFADFVALEAEAVAGPGGAAETAFWLEELAGAPLELDLAPDRPRREGRGTPRSGYLDFTVPKALAAALFASAREQRMSLVPVLLGAFERVLHERAGQRDLLLGATVAARPAGFEDTLGYFQNLLAIRSRADVTTNVGGLVSQAQKRLQRALQHRVFPFGSVVEKLRPPRHPSRPPVIQVVLNHQRTRLLNEEDDRTANAGSGLDFASVVSGVELQFRPEREVQTLFDLELLTIEGRGELFPRFVYNADLFDAASLVRMSERLVTTLEDLLQRPDTPVFQSPV